MDQNVPYPPSPEFPVHHPVMRQGWKDLGYLHWPYDPDVVQQRLPTGLPVDTFEGKAWVGLVALQMERTRLPGTPAAPYLGTFPETNVRTHVRGRDGRPGVWFDSLDVTRLLPVLVVRSTYRLPYMWSKMSIVRVGNQVSYAARRRWPGPRGASSSFAIQRGDRIPASDVSPLEHFLTARWGLHTRLRDQLAFALVDHSPWPLERAEVEHFNDQLVAAVGYQAPNGQPIVRYSPGVGVRIGLPRRVDG